MTYNLKWEKAGLVIEFGGTLTSLDLINSNSEFIGDGRIDKVKYIISDLSNVDEIDIDYTDIEISKDFAVRSNRINPAAKVAIVASQPVLTGLVEGYISAVQAEIPYARFRSFRQVQKARDWVAS